MKKRKLKKRLMKKIKKMKVEISINILINKLKEEIGKYHIYKVLLPLPIIRLTMKKFKKKS